MDKNAKIFVAGHNGLAGSAIVRRLQAAGYDRIITRSRRDLDLTDQQAVARFFKAEKPEFVFLAAAKVGGIYANQTYPAEFIYQNLAIQTHVIHQSYLHQVKRLLFLGSSCIYPKLTPQPMQEQYLLTGPLEPTNTAYAVAKIAGIEMCWSYNRQYNTRFIPVMPTNLYGPGDNFDLLNSHVLPALIRKFHLAKLAVEMRWKAIQADEQIFGAIPEDIKIALGIDPQSGQVDTDHAVKVVLWGSGRPQREFLYSEDLADGCLFLMNLSWDKLTAFQTKNNALLFNIGTGVDLSIRDMAALTAKVVGFEGTVAWDERMPDGSPRKLQDVSRLQNLGWQAQISLTDGLAKTYQWYQNQMDLSSIGIHKGRIPPLKT